MIRLAIVEDDRDAVEALQLYFSSAKGFDNVRIAYSVEEFVLMIDKGYYPDVILQDIQLSGMSGIEAISIYKNRIPNAKILMNSVLQNSESIFSAICAGALGYIEKGYSLEKIKEAIISLYNGGSPMSPGIARHVINYFNPVKKFEEDLSPREREVVQGILDGLSYKMIAEKHGVSIDTIRTQITRIYRKLQINSKGELIARYLKK